MKGLEFVKITEFGNELYKGFVYDSDFSPLVGIAVLSIYLPSHLTIS